MSAMIVTAIDEAVDELVPLVGKKAACAAVGLPRASYYRANPTGEETEATATTPAAELGLPRRPAPQAPPRA